MISWSLSPAFCGWKQVKADRPIAVSKIADRQARWQTPRQRQRAQQTSFQISIGREIMPGVLAEMMHPVISSDSEVSWTATFTRSPANCPQD